MDDVAPSKRSSRTRAPKTATTPLGEDGLARCAWVTTDRAYLSYHDDEWGRPVTDDQRLFEKICLEGFQAGLSWLTILKRRQAFRKAFFNFDIERVAAMSSTDVSLLLENPEIIRNRAKIEAAIHNAQITLQLHQPPQGASLPADRPRSLHELLWSFAPKHHERPRNLADLASTTPESEAMSAALRKLGFRFVGPTTLYALMQSTGMVDDHIKGCFRAN